MYIFMSLCYTVVIIALMYMGYLIIRLRSSKEQLAFLLCDVTLFFVIVGMNLEFTMSDTISSAQMAMKIQYMGQVIFLMAFLWFSSLFAKLQIPKIVYFIQVVVSSIVLFSVITISYNGWFFSSMKLVPDGYYPRPEVTMGPICYLHYIHMLIVFAFVFVSTISKYRKSSRIHKKRIVYLDIGIVVVVIEVVLKRLGLFGSYNFFVLTALILILCLYMGMIQYGYLDSVAEKAEQALKIKYHEDMETLQAVNDAKAEFMAHMSHEIRTPINTIHGMSEMILRESKEENIVSYAQDIKEAEIVLMQLVDDILNVSEVEQDVGVTKADAQARADESLKALQDESHICGRILLVDDNAMNRKVLRLLLKRTNLYVEEAASGQQCLKMIEKNPPYDIVLMDQMMPEMSGVETFRRMVELPKYQAHPMPVIAVTANALKGARKMYLAEGFDEYLAKPISYEDLMDVLKQYLELEESKKEEPKESTDFEKRLQFYREKGICVEQGIRYSDDSVEFFLELLKDFKEEYVERYSKFTKLYQEKNYRTLLVEAHSLKNNAASLGMEELREVAFQMEQLLRHVTEKQESPSHWQDDLQKLYEKLVIKWEELQAFL